MCPSDLLLLDERPTTWDLDAILWRKMEDFLKELPGTLLLEFPTTGISSTPWSIHCPCRTERQSPCNVAAIPRSNGARAERLACSNRPLKSKQRNVRT